MRTDEQLWRMVYISSSVTADVSAIAPGLLKAARRNNERNGVTGVLIFCAGSFLQVLEGLRSDVETTFARIRRDTRHRGLIMLLEEPIEDRMFSGWSMSWLDMPKSHPLNAELTSTIDNIRQSQAAAPSGEKIRILLSSFAATAP